MKKVFLFLMMIILNACVVSGDFTERRNRLHELGRDDAYCQKNPDKCVDGIPW